MPNDCNNYLTITSTHETDIENILEEINSEIPNVVVKQKTKLGVKLYYTTAWVPNIDFIKQLIDKYPLLWLKNDWIVEDGTAGILIGNKDEFKSFDWFDLSIEAEYFHFHK